MYRAVVVVLSIMYKVHCLLAHLLAIIDREFPYYVNS